jgi:23S rRNA pseudouridine1911/1915/1917 synthase
VVTPPRAVETFVVAEGEAGRLDQFLVRHLSGCSRRLARRAIAAGTVLVNGRPVRKGQALRPGDVVSAVRVPAADTLAAQEDLALPILYADAALVAVDKPAGLPAAALRADDRDTVANYLLARYPELRGIGGSAFESGLAHRLDNATSGVLVAGRTAAAWRHLRAQFRRRAVDKLYLAVVAGAVGRPGRITSPIAHQPRRRRRMCVCPEPPQASSLGARPAMTHYRPLRRLRGATLLALRIPTGVRHQIRVHLASIGHPVLGDLLYADASAAAASPRLLLHAARLGFAHPIDGRRIIVRSRLPADFQAALPAEIALR